MRGLRLPPCGVVKVVIVVVVIGVEVVCIVSFLGEMRSMFFRGDSSTSSASDGGTFSVKGGKFIDL